MTVKIKNAKIFLLRKSRKGVPIYEENPFWSPHEIKLGKKFIKVSGGIYKNHDGETISQSGIHIIEEKDEEEFIKLYTKNMKLFFDLKPSTQKVLMAILNAIQKSPGTDSIYLNWFSVQDYNNENNLGISETSFYRSLKDLLDKGFIAESKIPNKYWINPHLFFNGDRMIFIKEYRKKEKDPLINK